MPYASLGPIAVHLPETIVTNDQLQAEFPDWDVPAIEAKTGIRQRYIAAADECSSDLAVAAVEKLLAEQHIDRGSIDFLLFCTQTPDYPLPTTACLLQQRLGLPLSCGALDFNLGCSGFVYGLGIADGLIQSGGAKRVLLVTAETYSKFIDPGDRSLRPIFGDAAAATLIEAADEPSVLGIRYGTDGSGADLLLVNSGGARSAAQALKPRGRVRWKSPLYMNGPALIDFTLLRIPELVAQVCERAHVERSSIDLYLVHQATWKLLSQVRDALGETPERLPIELSNYGNTVSCTLPILINDLRRSGRLTPGMRSMLIGFGVGLSWAGACWTETWR